MNNPSKVLVNLLQRFPISFSVSSASLVNQDLESSTVFQAVIFVPIMKVKKPISRINMLCINSTNNILVFSNAIITRNILKKIEKR